MFNVRNFLISSIGVATSFTGMAISTTELSEIISIITGVLGLVIVIITSIVIPVVKWFIKARKDGKIDDEEIIELCDTVENGVKKIDNSTNKKEGEGKHE